MTIHLWERVHKNFQLEAKDHGHATHHHDEAGLVRQPCEEAIHSVPELG